MSECRHCKEEIREGASKCPRCHGWQSGWAANPGSPRAMLGIVLPLLLLAFVAFVPLRDLFFPSDPADLAAFLEITGSKMQRSVGSDGRRYVTIVGTLRNTGGSTLENPHFAVEFRDAGGELIDSTSASELWLILAPGAERAFTIRGVAVKPESEYASYEVEITGAARGRVF